jgi:cell division protein FtsN
MRDMNTPQNQRGGTFLGFILGLVVGLGVALGVAMYVTKVPTPFSNKNQTRSSDQDAVENQKNKDWNPNGVLQPKATASAPAEGAITPAPAPAAVPALPGAVEAPRKEVKPAVNADPIADLVKSKAADAGADASEPFQYFVQVGAYRTQAEADAQKARITLMGLEARVSEREQAGRIVYRVRLGPFDDKAVAERLHTRLDGAQIDNTIVRMQR